MWGSNDTNSPLNCSCVFPSPPDFCSPLLLPVCRLEATSSSSSFSRTNLSGHNRLPLQLCCFWNGNPFSPACSPSWLTEISQKDTLLWGIYSISPLSTDSRFFFLFLSQGVCLLLLINVEVVWSWPPSWGSLQDVKSFSSTITFNTSNWKSVTALYNTAR